MSDNNAIAAPKTITEPIILDPIKGIENRIVILPNTDGSYEIESLFPHTHQRKESLYLCALASFLQYTNDFATKETKLFSNKDAATVTAIFDYLPESVAEQSASELAGATKEHTATLKLKKTKRFLEWAGIADAKGISQARLAEFLDEHIEDVLSPAQAELLETIQKIEGYETAEFKARQMLRDGSGHASLKVSVVLKGGEHGEYTLPDTITIAVKVYENTEPLTLLLKVRFRVKDGGLFFILIPHQWEKALDFQWQVITEQIAEETGLTIYQQ